MKFSSKARCPVEVQQEVCRIFLTTPLTQKEIAEQFGITRTSVANYARKWKHLVADADRVPAARDDYKPAA